MAQTILVTGATGFIGRVVVGRLLARGVPPDRLRCLVRDPERAARAGLPPASLVAGDLGDAGALARAAQRVDGVIHLAGITRAVRDADLFAANSVGTARIAETVADAAPGARFVHVSSLAAAGPGRDGAGSAAPPDRCRPCSVYGRSKLGGEIEMLARSPRLDWCVVRPPIVYGPADEGTRMLFRQVFGPFAPVPWRRRPLSLIHVDDLARALELALDRRGVHGFFPVEGPDRVDTDSLVDQLAAACGRRPRRVRVPMVVPRLLAPVADLVARMRGRPSFFNADKMREAAAEGWVADPAPARAALGFEPEIAVARGLADTVRADPWLRDRAAPTQA